MLNTSNDWELQQYENYHQYMNLKHIKIKKYMSNCYYIQQLM
jgi:hypothetical protein